MRVLAYRHVCVCVCVCVAVVVVRWTGLYLCYVCVSQSELLQPLLSHCASASHSPLVTLVVNLCAVPMTTSTNSQVNALPPIRPTHPCVEVQLAWV